jgi:DNA-binding GntR family transcriptional regulator
MGDQDFQYKSLTECVTDYLKRQLNNSALKPGDEINIGAISETLGISRTPIREALIQLLKDGFVEIVSRRKFFIKRLTLQDIEHIYQVVGLLEAEGAKDACNRMTDSEILELEGQNREMEEALKKGDTQKYLSSNSRSHALILKYCDNPILLEIAEKLKERLYVFPKLISETPDWVKKLLNDHHEMIRCIKKKDPQALEDLIKNEHWNFSKNYKFVTKYYERFNKNNPSTNGTNGSSL